MRIYNITLKCGCMIAEDTGTKDNPDGNSGIMPCYAEYGDMRKKKDKEALKLHEKCMREYFQNPPSGGEVVKKGGDGG